MKIAAVIPAVVVTFALGASVIAGCSHDTTTTAPIVPDPTAAAYSFAVIGCNRVDKADTAGNVSTANIEQLNRTFTEIAALNPRPKFLFFLGDLTLGYTPDTVQLEKELRGWIALYQASPLASGGTELVAVPGNHETQDITKISYAAAERTWLRVMAPYIQRGGNGPKAGGVDALQTDQSGLTYSFDYQGAHFVTLNTDPVGQDWHVPANWAAADIAAARAAGAKHIFAFGHKPAFSYPTVADDGLNKYPASRNVFWNALVANHAEAMFSAHNHVYYRTQPQGAKTWQVIAGNGGSPLEATLDQTIASTGAYYGFSVVTVTNGGTVYMKGYGRDIPVSYVAAASAATYPTTMRDSVNITWQ